MFFTFLTEWTAGNVALRLIASLALGSVIGIDRGAKRRGGGARTDATVCMGAALVMITAQYMYVIFSGDSDIARMGAQAVSGVGFLGAGSIIVSGHQVKGLTSAASVWFCACIGLATGIGLVDGAVLAVAVLLAGLHLLPLVEEKIYQHSRYVNLNIEVEDSRAAVVIMRKLKNDGCKIDLYDVVRPRTGGQYFTILSTVHIPRNLNKESYLNELAGIKGICSLDTV